VPFTGAPSVRSASTAKWREDYFYSDPSIVEREVADLAKAGLPEK
jgi:hypothetical protein